MYKRFGKRTFDLLFSILLMPIFISIFIITTIAIIIEDKGSIFYIQKRLGKDGKIYGMFKFRSMKINAPDLRNEDGSTYNSDDDPRVTKVGKFIRKTSIDEIPQILNVLKGDMSFIGPRPDLPDHLKLYSKEEKKKLNVLPGITGYNQAYYRNSIEWKARLKNDVYYVENISLLFDIKIFFKTFDVVLNKKGIYVDEQNKNIGM